MHRTRSVLAAALALLSLAASASAQAVTPGVPPETPDPGVETGNRPILGWSFTPSFVYAGGWDDNVLLRGNGDATEFRRRFDLMSLQRNLKALGTFGYQTMTRRNSVYIQYMPRTLRYARTNLDKYPRFARLRDLLARHIEELR